MDAALNDLLATNADEVKPLPPHPAGWFRFDIMVFAFGESSRTHTDYVEYDLRNGEPHEGVDQDAWEEFSSEQSSETKATFYLTPKALYRLTEFLKNAGVDLTGRQLKDCIPEACSNKILVEITHSVSERDGETVTYANASKFKAYE